MTLDELAQRYRELKQREHELKIQKEESCQLLTRCYDSAEAVRLRKARADAGNLLLQLRIEQENNLDRLLAAMQNGQAYEHDLAEYRDRRKAILRAESVVITASKAIDQEAETSGRTRHENAAQDHANLLTATREELELVRDAIAFSADDAGPVDPADDKEP
jgi:hypothetical protein